MTQNNLFEFSNPSIIVTDKFCNDIIEDAKLIKKHHGMDISTILYHLPDRGDAVMSYITLNEYYGLDSAVFKFHFAESYNLVKNKILQLQSSIRSYEVFEIFYNELCWMNFYEVESLEYYIKLIVDALDKK